MEIEEAKAETVEIQPDAGSEALIISERGSRARTKDNETGTRDSVARDEARALATRTSARTPETRSSGAVDVPVNDGCTPT